MNNVIINTKRESYGIDNILNNTMTINELIEYLQDNYNGNEKIVLSFDNGYTYGSISEYNFINECND